MAGHPDFGMPEPVSAALGGALARPGERAGSARAEAAARHVLVAGGVGRLGGAVLEQLLRDGGFASVLVLAHRPVAVALSGLRVLQVDGGAVPAPLPPGTDTAVVVLDRSWSRHGRESAFVHADQAALPGLAAGLHGAGVRRLVLVVPHAAGRLPAALRNGLATREEHAVAAHGFEQLVLVRPAAADRTGTTGAASGARWLHRLAAMLLAQLHWMLPQREQPLRPQRVAEAVALLTRELGQARPGTRVLGPEGLWAWAQPSGGVPWLRAWLADAPLPPVAAPRHRW